MKNQQETSAALENNRRAMLRSCRPRRNQSPRRAFTIVEMMIVLLIMGILAATATPSFFRSLRHHRLESAARRVKLDLEQTRIAARLKSQSQSLTFSGPMQYTMTAGVQGIDTAGGAYTVNLADAPFELDGVAIDFGGPTVITFDGFGTASAEGSIVLAAGSETRTVTLENSNGDITISNP